MRDQFAPVIADFDCDGITDPFSFQSETFYEDGGNGGTMMDGTTVQDVLAVKHRFSWALNVLTMAQYNALVSALDSGTVPDTVSATVYYPDTDTRYTTTFHATSPIFRFVLDINRAMVAVATTPLVLEEAGDEKTVVPVIVSDDDWTLYDDGTLDIDPLPDGSPETEDDRWRRILNDLDTPSGDPNTPIHDVDRIVLKPGVPSLPSGIPEQFPNLDTIVISPNVQIPPDEFDNCPGLTVIKIVSFPSKSDYFVGEALDYDGLHVVEIIDSAERDITPECVLRPAEGYVTNVVEDIMVDVRYHDKSLGTFWVEVAAVEVIDGGDWWRLFNTGRLEVYCVGDMPYYSSSPPWYSNRQYITSAIIRDSVTAIGDNAFRYCTSLINVTIPDSVTSIGGHAFYACYSLVSITIPYSVTDIGEHAFNSCDALTSVTIQNGVTSIGMWAFSFCIRLISVTIPGSVTSIGVGAFSDCASLASITIPSGVTSIENSAFRNCSGLTSVTIPSGVTSIGDYAFSGCSGLTSITIPGSVTSIGQSAFSNCSGLTDVYYGGTEAQWNTITIGSYNMPLTRSTIHYNSSPT